MVHEGEEPNRVQGRVVKAIDAQSADNNKNSKLRVAGAVSAALENAKLGESGRSASVSSHDEGEEEEELPGLPGRDESSHTKDFIADLQDNTTPLRPKQWLPKDFQPHQNDVLCGRGKTYREWPGNVLFRIIVENHLQDYKQSVGRSEKGVILTRVVEAVRNQEGATGFLKQGGAGRWYEVGDFYAREKTSQLFRDCLHENYSSSNMTKKKKRQEERMVVEQMKRRRSNDKVEKEKPAASAHAAVTAPYVPSVPLPPAMTSVTTKSAPFPYFANPAAAAAEAALNASKRRVAFTAALAVNAGLVMQQEAASLRIGSPQQSATKKDKSLERDVASVLHQLAGVASGQTPPGPLLPRVSEVSSAVATMPTGAAVSATKSQPFFRSIPAPAELTVCALQPGLRGPEDSPLDATTRILDTIEKISSRKLIDVFVLPEMSPVGYSEDTFTRFLPKNSLMKDMYFLIDEAFAMRAQRLSVYICYGTVGWRENADGKEVYTIRQKVVDRSGKVVAVYDKMFLRDYEEYAESRFFVAGPPTPVSFQVDQFRLGLMICSDVRYPQLARALARDHKVDAILQPCAFTRDRSFRTWRAFRETRAVENSVYFIGVNYAGENYGHSCMTPPWVDDEHEPDQLGTEDGFLVGKVERCILDVVRTTMPFHRQLGSDLKESWD